MLNQLIAPYGGALVNLIEPASGDALKQEALGLPSLELDWRQQCELEMLMTGAYSVIAALASLQWPHFRATPRLHRHAPHASH